MTSSRLQVNTRTLPKSSSPHGKILENSSISTFYTNTKLRQQAVELLDKADVLAQQHLAERKELDYYLLTLPRSNYQRKLFRPAKINPRTSSSPSPIRKPATPIRPLRPPYPPITS